jgi:hypothetical protein
MKALSHITHIIIALLCATPLMAQHPLYVVNGKVVDGIEHIPQSDIESIEVLPADEGTIAEWGLAASEGVIAVRLIYDTPASFSAEGIDNYTAYLAKSVKWDSNMPAERASLRIAIAEDGTVAIAEVLDYTSRQFLKRLTKAIAISPRWQPAIRDGRAIESLHLVNIQLPVGKELPSEHYVIIH